MSKAKWTNYTKEQLQEIIYSVRSNAAFMKALGYSGQGGNTTVTIQKIKDTYPDLDFSHFTGQAWNKGLTKEKDGIAGGGQEKYSIDDIFVKDSAVTQKVMRGYVERHKLIEYKCSHCGCDGSWQGGQIALEIHHINGDNTDNRLENLCYLCPNCHALTDNYRGLNKK